MPTSEYFEIRASGKFKQILVYATDDIKICTNQDKTAKTADSNFVWPKNTFWTLNKDDTEAYEKKYHKPFKSIFIISNTGNVGEKLYWQFIEW